MTTRRAFIHTIAGSVLAVPLAAAAQQVGKVYRIGILEAIPEAQNAANKEADIASRLLSHPVGARSSSDWEIVIPSGSAGSRFGARLPCKAI